MGSYRLLNRVLVENQEALKNLELVLVRHRASDSVVQLLVTQRLLRLQPLVGQCGPVTRASDLDQE